MPLKAFRWILANCQSVIYQCTDDRKLQAFAMQPNGGTGLFCTAVGTRPVASFLDLERRILHWQDDVRASLSGIPIYGL